jgi:hypothetical protein
LILQFEGRPFSFSLTCGAHVTRRPLSLPSAVLFHYPLTKRGRSFMHTRASLAFDQVV